MLARRNEACYILTMKPLMELDSALLLSAIGSLTAALLYLYRRSEMVNASIIQRHEESLDAIKKELHECQERERILLRENKKLRNGNEGQ